MKGYLYGMRLRGYAPMCQPKDGIVARMDFIHGMPDVWRGYHDVLVYSRQLGACEIKNYELDYLGKAELYD